MKVPHMPMWYWPGDYREEHGQFVLEVGTTGWLFKRVLIVNYRDWKKCPAGDAVRCFAVRRSELFPVLAEEAA